MNGIQGFSYTFMLAVAASAVLPGGVSADPVIVLPRDYPSDGAEPLRSGISINTYFRMLGDHDPVYRFFGLSQINRFDRERLGHSLVGMVDDRMQQHAETDPHPGVRFMAMHLLAAHDRERAEPLARRLLSDLPEGSPEWALTLTHLLCRHPDELLPVVRERIRNNVIDGDIAIAGGHRWRAAIVHFEPFERATEFFREILFLQLEWLLKQHASHEGDAKAPDGIYHLTVVTGALEAALLLQMERYPEDAERLRAAQLAIADILGDVLATTALASLLNERAASNYAGLLGVPTRDRLSASPPVLDPPDRSARRRPTHQTTNYVQLVRDGAYSSMSDLLSMLIASSGVNEEAVPDMRAMIAKAFEESFRSHPIEDRHNALRDAMAEHFVERIMSSDLRPRDRPSDILPNSHRALLGGVVMLFDDADYRRIVALSKAVGENEPKSRFDHTGTWLIAPPCWDDETPLPERMFFIPQPPTRP